jgi:hypothetical protein
LSDLSTPKRVQKLLTALHAKAKAETGYRFYGMYDKISHEDILAHAYARCRSNKGASGVDADYHQILPNALAPIIVTGSLTELGGTRLTARRW